MATSMDYYQALARMVELQQMIQHLQSEERALREGIFAGTFPNPKEGVNEYTLPDGRIVKGTYKLNRSLDEELALVALKALGLTKKTGPVREKLELDLKKYRLLTAEQHAIFDKCLTIKPGLPSLTVVIPEPTAEVTAPFSG